MQRAALLLGVLGLLLATSDLSAQDKPNFAGTWTIVADADAGAAGGGGGGGARGGRGGRGGGRGGIGMSATIVQDAATVTITRMQGGNEVKYVYNLDGSESKNTVQGRGGAQEQTSKAAWDGSKLVITTSFMAGDNQIQTTMALSLNADGQLVVESTGMGRGGAGPTTTTTRYTKGG